MANKLVEIALSQYGVKEIEGTKHNQTIVNYAKQSGFTWVNDDETPWCSIFMNWVAKQAGFERTKKANARSWLEIGEPVLLPSIGDVVVLKRGTSEWQGHVGIFISFSEDDNFINLLGGNQGNSVSIAKYKESDVLGYRRLKEV